MPNAQETPREDRIERRFVPFEDCELRVEAAAEGPGQTEGYIALYNRWSPVYFEGTPWAFRERIAPGFFDEALARDDIRHLINHDANQVLGRNRSGTARYRSDKKGLWHSADLPDTSFARDLAVSMKRRDITGASFAFSLPADGSGEEIKRGKNGVTERTLTRAERVYDSSIVTYPFYVETDVAARHVRSWLGVGEGEGKEENVVEPEPAEEEKSEEAPPKDQAPALDTEVASLALSMGLGGVLRGCWSPAGHPGGGEAER